MRFVLYPAGVAIVTLLTGCASHCSGRVVGADGAPVRQALVCGKWSRDVAADPRSERIILEQKQADNNGYFTFDSQGKPLWILADSPDLKRSGRLAPHSMIANTVVVQ
jgi:hypothetical protein